MDMRVLGDGRHIVENEWPMKTVMVRPKASNDEQHRDESTQFQQSTSLSELTAADQPRVSLLQNIIGLMISYTLLQSDTRALSSEEPQGLVRRLHVWVARCRQTEHLLECPRDSTAHTLSRSSRRCHATKQASRYNTPPDCHVDAVGTITGRAFPLPLF